MKSTKPALLCLVAGFALLGAGFVVSHNVASAQDGAVTDIYAFGDLDEAEGCAATPQTTFSPEAPYQLIMVHVTRIEPGTLVETWWYRDGERIATSEHTLDDTGTCFYFGRSRGDSPWKVGTYTVEVHIGGAFGGVTQFQVVEDPAPAPTATPNAGSAAEMPVVTLSVPQETLLEESGYPDAFDIIEMDGPDGEPHRYEVWTYFKQNAAYVFLDGVFQHDTWEAYPPGGVIPVTVSPDQFPLGVSKEALRARFNNRQWEVFTNDGLTEDGLEFMVSEQIILGFKDDRLVYVETVAYRVDGGAQ